MFCQNCGGKLEPSAKFCVFCGAAVSVVKATPKAETKANHIAEKKDTIAEQKVEKKDSVKTAQEVIIEDAPEAEETQNELNTDSSSNLSISSSKNKIIIVASTLTCISEDVNIESVEIHGEQLCYTRNTAEWDNDGVYFCNLDGSNKWRFTP